MARTRRIGEFALIARYFAPLARGFAGAGNLESDNAFLAADPKHDLVVKTDTVVSAMKAQSIDPIGGTPKAFADFARQAVALGQEAR